MTYDELLTTAGMTYDELLNMYAVEYLTDNHYYDDILNDMETFNNAFSNKSPIEIAYAITCGGNYGEDNGTFNPAAPYYYFNGYGNPVSVYVSPVKYYNDIISKNDFMEYCIDNGYLE